MVNKFLKAKHWQVFSSTSGIVIIFLLVMIGFAIFNPDSSRMPSFIKFAPVTVMVICMGIFACWVWSIAIGLQSKVPEGIKMKVARFRIFFFIPITLILLFSVFIGAVINGLIDSPITPSDELYKNIFAIIHLFFTFCILHSLYFAAKTFKTVELQRDVTFSNFAGEFFMIWFHPVGIWILQPKINKIIQE